MLRITSKTDATLTATCSPLYIQGILCLFFLCICYPLFADGNFGGGVFFLLVFIPLLLFNRGWKLVINKQTNEVKVTSRSITGLLPNRKVASLDDVVSVALMKRGFGNSYSFGLFFARFVYVEFSLRNGTIQFGLMRPHYLNPFMDYWKNFARPKEADVVEQIADFMGVSCFGTERNTNMILKNQS
jgi:hypothetical protein